MRVRVWLVSRVSELVVLTTVCSFGGWYDWCVRVWEGSCMRGVYGEGFVRGSE